MEYLKLRAGELEIEVGKGSNIHFHISGNAGTGVTTFLTTLMENFSEDYAPWDAEMELLDLTGTDGTSIKNNSKIRLFKYATPTNDTQKEEMETLQNFIYNILFLVEKRLENSIRKGNPSKSEDTPRLVIINCKNSQKIPLKDMTNALDYIIKLGRSTNVHLIFANAEGLLSSHKPLEESLKKIQLTPSHVEFEDKKYMKPDYTLPEPQESENIVPMRLVARGNNIPLTQPNKTKRNYIEVNVNNIKLKIGETGISHLNVYGVTGSGKTHFVRNLITKIIGTYTPKDIQINFTDFKGVEGNLIKNYNPYINNVTIFKPYKSITESLIDKPEAVIQSNLSQFLVDLGHKIDARLELLNKYEVSCLSELEVDLPREIYIAEEFPITREPKFTSILNSLLSLCRAVGIHIIFITQSPINKVLTNTVKELKIDNNKVYFEGSWEPFKEMLASKFKKILNQEN